MPKIPTFTSRGRITAEGPSVATNLRISPTASTAAGLLPAADAITEYHIKQRDNNEKLEARKTFYEMKSESDKIIKKYENEPDDFKSVNGYNQEFNVYRDQKLSNIKNKRVKRRLEDLLVADQAETVYKIKKNSFKAFEVNENQSYNDGQTIFANEYTLETDKNEKEKILNKRLELAKEHGDMHLKGEAWLKKEIQKIRTDSVILDADFAIANKNYGLALQILQNAKNVDSEEVQKKVLQIQKEGAEFSELSFFKNKILKDKENPFLGTSPKLTTEKKVLESLDSDLIGIARNKNASEGTTFLYVDGAYAETGILSPYYEDLFSTAYSAGSSTTFDNVADIPDIVNQAVEAAEAAELNGRLNVYTSDDEERFFKNVIVLKQILGLDNFQAIKQAKEFEMNYDKAIIQGANRQRNKLLGDIEDKFDEVKGTNIQDVRGYANKLYNIYVSNGIGDYKARQQVKKDIKENLIVVDDYAYLKRDISAFQAIGPLNEVKTMKEFILEKNIKDVDKDEYYLRYNGGGQFEIRRRVDISPVYNDEGQPMIYYAKDMYILNQERVTSEKEKIKQNVFQEQEIKQKRAEEQAITGFDITGS
tara:strand:+ start:503 stop:2278 length:1776 start_codon:yes stop_codon:yes gene_type:complete